MGRINKDGDAIRLSGSATFGGHWEKIDKNYGKNYEKNHPQSNQKSGQRSTQIGQQTSNGGLNGGLKLTDRQYVIVDIVRQYGGLKVDDIALKLKFGKRTIERELATLQKQGVVRRVDSKKGGHWEIIEQST